MFRRVACVALILVIGALEQSCAFVDQFSPRVYQNNLNYQDANSQEALVNIVRASRFEALSFASITQSNGSQSETLGTGFPTFTLGPGQTVAQHQFVFAGNSLSSSASGGFQANPLISSNFIQGMLTPINEKVLALLIGTYPRAWMYYAIMDGIKLTGYVKTTNEKKAFYFRNDPKNDRLSDGSLNGEQCMKILDPTARVDFTAPIYDSDAVCNFSKFAALLQRALDFGLSVEIKAPPSTGQKGGGNQPGKGGQGQGGLPGSNSPPNTSSTQQSSTTSTTSTPSSVGHICWDPTLAVPALKATVLSMTNACGNTGKASSEYKFDFDTVMITNIQFVFRSPYGVYEYLGALLRENSADQITRRIQFNYQSRSFRTLAEEELASGPFLNILPDVAGSCIVEAFYNGRSYCVPRQQSAGTSIMLDILSQLKNLSTTPSDLNSAFAVRVVD